MRGSTLGLVRSKVKAEAMKSLDSQATSQDAEINQIIENVQQELADSYDWAFLKVRWDVTVPAGQRFTAFPTTTAVQGGTPIGAVINFQRPLELYVKWNAIWQPVIYGIDEIPEFNYLDADRNQVLDPIQRFQYSDETKFEVWPLPASNAQLRFVQNRQLTSLQTGSSVPPVWNDNATLDLDDLLVVYHVAALYLTREDQEPAAQLALSRAKERLQRILQINPIRTQLTTIGRGNPLDRRAIRQIPLVMVAGNTK